MGADAGGEHRVIYLKKDEKLLRDIISKVDGSSEMQDREYENETLPK